MDIGQSELNILKALYEDSSIIRLYVDTVAKGNPLPYNILIKDKEMEQNEAIVEKIILFEQSIEKQLEFNLNGVMPLRTIGEVLLEALGDRGVPGEKGV